MCLTYFKCMLLIKNKMMLFRKVVSSRLVGWMTARGALQNGIRAMVSTLSLDGPDKWSWTELFLRRNCVREPISNPRMFLSFKESLDRVTKLRRFSGILESVVGVVYGHQERERVQRMRCWGCRICSGGKENPHDRHIWRTCVGLKTLWSCTGMWKSRYAKS
jgi:hypothetical protein